jgi:hypothetical protein
MVAHGEAVDRVVLSDLAPTLEPQVRRGLAAAVSYPREAHGAPRAEVASRACDRHLDDLHVPRIEGVAG